MWGVVKRGLWVAGKVFLAGAAAVGGGVLAKQAVHDTQDLGNQIGQKMDNWRIRRAEYRLMNVPAPVLNSGPGAKA